MNQCVFEGCTNKRTARGYCRGHYAQLSRGKELKPLRNYNAASRIDEDGRDCTKCGIYKPWSEFYELKTGINGKSPRCSECAKAIETARYQSRK